VGEGDRKGENTTPQEGIEEEPRQGAGDRAQKIKELSSYKQRKSTVKSTKGPTEKAQKGYAKKGSRGKGIGE